MSGSDQKHWDRVYGNKGEFQVSWFQDDPALSLELVRVAAPSLESAIIDIGGGAARLVDALLAHDYRDVTVLDLSKRRSRSSGRDWAPERAGNVDSRRRDALATGATLRPLARPRRFPFPYRSARPRGLCGAAHGGAAAKWTRHHRDLCARGPGAMQRPASGPLRCGKALSRPRWSLPTHRSAPAGSSHPVGEHAAVPVQRV
jgi:hypothetical protein